MDPVQQAKGQGVICPDKLIEEIRCLGNDLFKKKDYRGAEMLYRSGLGLMVHVSEVAGALGTAENNLKAAVLLLNQAQALLNLSNHAKDPTATAVEVTVVCLRAQWHIRNAQQFELNVAARYVPLCSQEAPSTKGASGALAHKSFVRRAIALERCGNIAGALIELMRIGERSSTEEKDLERLGALLRKLGTSSSKGSFMREFWGLNRRSDTIFHRAEVSQGDIVWTFCAKEVFPGSHGDFEMDRAFSCGSFMDSVIFVARYPITNARQPVKAYSIYSWRKDGKSIDVHHFGLFWTPEESTADYTTGGVIHNHLVCLSLTETPVAMCCSLLPDGSGIGEYWEVPIEPCTYVSALTPEVMQRAGAEAVACKDALHIWGGYQLVQNGQRKAFNSILVFKPVMCDGQITSLTCGEIQTTFGGSYIEPRWGHATFAWSNIVAFFGGTDGTRDSHGRPTVFEDMWTFNAETFEINRVDAFGSMPCARAFPGVAYNGDRCILMGGWTKGNLGKPLLLADVWEFHPTEALWVQVVPRDERQLWISARHSAACAIIGDSDLYTLGGYGSNNRFINSETHFTIARAAALAFLETIRTEAVPLPGPKRDLAVERTVSAMSALQPDLACMPDKVAELLKAPAGSITVFTSTLENIAEGVFTPQDVRNSFAKSLPPRCCFSASLQMPLRHLNAESLWGAQECPFIVAPRWLGAPAEVGVNLSSTPSAANTTSVGVERFGLSQAMAIRQTMKHFGTVKAAVQYYRLCQPRCDNNVSSGWRPVQGFESAVEEHSAGFTAFQAALGVVTAFPLMEVTGVHLIDDSAGQVQVYVMAVYGPVFICMLATYPWQPGTFDRNTAFPLAMCQDLIRMQAVTLFEKHFKPRLACCHCGQPSSVAVEGSSICRTKVCKGCRMVRYCSMACQKADWAAHKRRCRQ